MKKLLTLALALLMVLSMTGCGSSSPAGEPEKPEPEKEIEFGLGTVENGVYKNEFLGIGFKMEQAGMHEVDNGNSNYRTKIKPEDLEKIITNSMIVELLAQSYEGNEFVRDSFNWIMSIEEVKDVNNTIEPESFMADKRTSRVKSASENYTDLEDKEINKKIGKAEFTGFELIFTANPVSNMKGGECHLLAKKGEYCYYITMITLYLGSENKTYDQIKENLDTWLNNYFYGL